MITESSLIGFLKSEFSDENGIGDDCAILPLDEKTSYVVSKDLLLENVHFDLSYTKPKDLAYKALHVNLSDIAAMGAKPLFVFLGLSIPLSHQNYAKSFLKEFASICKKEDVILLGGDTTASKDGLFLSVTVIGAGPTSLLKRRNSARPGDILAVAGNCGFAHIGWKLLELEQDVFGYDDFRSAFLNPFAKVQEGLFLKEYKQVHAMMDISDGLYLDTLKLCKASNVCAKFEIAELSEGFLEACDTLSLCPIETFLSGGEDYALLVSIEPDSFEEISQAFKKTLAYDLKKVGTVEEISAFPKKPLIRIFNNGEEIFPNINPFTHFGEKP